MPHWGHFFVACEYNIKSTLKTTAIHSAYIKIWHYVGGRLMKLQDNKREKAIQKEVTKERIGSSFPKPLNPEEESYYLALYENGNEEEKKLAKDILIERNLRLVAHIAKKYHNGDSEDLISIGTIGLIKGIASYNSKRGVKLATYIARCIENTIHYKR